MQTIRPTATRHGTSSKLIDNDYFVVLHNVIHIFLEQDVRSQTGYHMMQQTDIGDVVEGLTITKQSSLVQQLLNMFMTFLSEIDLFGFFID